MVVGVADKDGVIDTDEETEGVTLMDAVLEPSTKRGVLPAMVRETLLAGSEAPSSNALPNATLYPPGASHMWLGLNPLQVLLPHSRAKHATAPGVSAV